jgi:PhnB protein
MSTNEHRAANGAHTANGRPHGSTSLTPFLAIPRAAEAVEFYRDVFGARVVDVTDMQLPAPETDASDPSSEPPGPPARVVVHADLDFGTGHLQLGEPVPDYRMVPPPAGDDDCYSMGLYVPDVDAVVERAVAAGATVREAPADFVSGDRFASIRDPFGVRWSVMTRVEDLSEEESVARVREWARSFES